MADQQQSQPTPQSNPLDAKILRVLGDRVILKPLTRWNEAYKEFRVGFARPNNIAVAERLNEERRKEVLVKGNAKPGSSHVGRSNDHRIAPWA